MTEPVRVLFAGDRPVCTRLVEVIRAAGDEVVGVGLNNPPRLGGETVRAAAGVDGGRVFFGRSFSSEVALRKFAGLEPHLGVSCGFAPILPTSMLKLPQWGWVNVHRSYLPYNRGLDPLQWAVVDGTPAGVSIHVMTEEVDAGPIIAQAEMPVLPTDDFDALEARSDRLVLDLFTEAWPRLRAGGVEGTPQDEDLATYHTWADCKGLRQLDLNATMKVRRVLDVLRVYSGADWSFVEFRLGLDPFPYRVGARVVPMAGIEHASPRRGPGEDGRR
ncbi:MAG TPA: formyltransferase family protein [Acidimicrobiales bacterium]|nr:formyltransferase family protein [Acidimicrobiales bacterium]